MSPCMEGIQPRIFTHLAETFDEPGFIRFPEDGAKLAGVVPGLEKWDILSDVVVTNDAAERVDGAHGAQYWTVIIFG